jgi:SlyX protein
MNERLTELEVRVAFQEKTIQDLNEVVTDQQRRIDRLTQELEAVKSRLAASAPSMVIPQEDEKPPPHYCRFARFPVISVTMRPSAHTGLHRSLRGYPSRFTSNNFNLSR